MRVGRLLTALVAMVVATGAVTSLAPGAQAAAAPIRVDGHDDLGASGLGLSSEDCSGSSTPPAVNQLSRLGGTLGTHSLGWQPALGYEAGVYAYSADPDHLTTLAADVLPTLGSTSGHVIAWYYDSSPGYTGGYWYGYASLNPSGASGTWLPTSGVSSSLTWTYYEGGYSEAGGTATIASFATARGGDGNAYVGLEFGCDGDPYYMDNLRVTDGAGARTWDFEGAPAMARQWLHNGVKWVTGGTVSIRVGQAVTVWADGKGPGVGEYFNGTGYFQTAPYGGSYRTSLTRAFTVSDYAKWDGIGEALATPQRRTAFRFLEGGSDFYGSDYSAPIVVEVVPIASLKIRDRTIRRGQKIVATGVLTPHNRGTVVKLQRKRSSGWRTIASTHTVSGGTYKVTKRARTTGKWIVRVLMVAGGGNLSTTTRSLKVVVKQAAPATIQTAPTVYTAPSTTTYIARPPDLAHRIAGVFGPFAKGGEPIEVQVSTVQPSCVRIAPGAPCSPGDPAR
jgi:hypothetical protein